jgi:hypothetical protein
MTMYDQNGFATGFQGDAVNEPSAPARPANAPAFARSWSSWRGVAVALGLFSFLQPVAVNGDPAFTACGRIENDGERLACYDSAYRASLEASGEKASVPDGLAAPVSDAPTPGAKVRNEGAEQRFGLPRPPDPDALDVLESRVDRLAETSQGRAAFYLQNAQVWVQDESRRLHIPEPPFDVRISPGRFGGFFMTLEGGGRIKVKRLK